MISFARYAPRRLLKRANLPGHVPYSSGLYISPRALNSQILAIIAYSALFIWARTPEKLHLRPGLLVKWLFAFPPPVGRGFFILSHNLQ
jgi:hypothetical protein